MGTLELWLLGALGFIGAFGLAVFVHELGHFLAAKAFKVPVERFVIGFDREAMPFMPRCIWEKKIGETTYGLSLVPLGGYVKMIGTVHPEWEKYLDGEEKKAEPAEGAEAGAAPKPASAVEQAYNDQAALYRKPFWQKTVIYSAGVIMNLLLAMIVVAAVNIKGQEVDGPLPAVVAWQPADSWLRAAGVEGGERLASLNGRALATNQNYYEVLSPLLGDAEDPEPGAVAALALELERDGARRTVELSVPLDQAERRSDLWNLISRPAYIDYVIINAAADKAGMKVGDTVVSIDGEPIDDWYELVHMVEGALGRDLAVEVRRGGELVALTVTPRESTDEAGVGRIGVIPGTPEKEIVRTPPLQALLDSPVIVAQNTVNYAENLKKIGARLLKLEVKKVREDLGGPVAIAQMAGRHAQLGLDRWLQFLIMLNIALAVMNILPIPVLDGGHIMLAAYEAVFRRPMPARILVPVLQGALFTLLAFFVLITFSDVLKIFS